LTGTPFPQRLRISGFCEKGLGHLGLSLTDPMRHAYNDVTYKCLGGKKAVLEN